MIYIAYFLGAWFMLSLWWLLHSYDRVYYRRDRWYDKVLDMPVVIIAYIVGWCLSKRKETDD